MSSVVVVGASGLIGRAIVHELESSYSIVGTHHASPTPGTIHFDLGSDKPLAIDWKSCRALVVAAGVTSLAQCASQPTVTRAINVDGVATLVSNAPVHTIVLSSGAVFSTAPGDAAPDETTEPSPTTEYGRQRRDLEAMISGPKRLILRLTKIADGFLDDIAARLRAGERVRAATDQRLSLLAASDVARVVRWAIETGATGLLHASTPPIRSRFEWCRRLAAAIGADSSLVEPCSISDFDDLAQGERMAREATLDSAKLRAALTFELVAGDDLIAGFSPGGA